MKQFYMILCLVLTILFSYALGYYRAYETRSLIHADMTLAMNEAAYYSLERNQLDQARNYLLVPIVGARHYIAERQRNPIAIFLKDYRTDRDTSFANRSRLMAEAAAMIRANEDLLRRNNAVLPPPRKVEEPPY